MPRTGTFLRPLKCNCGGLTPALVLEWSASGRWRLGDDTEALENRIRTTKSRIRRGLERNVTGIPGTTRILRAREKASARKMRAVPGIQAATDLFEVKSLVAAMLLRVNP